MRAYRYKVTFLLEGNGMDGRDFENEIIITRSYENAKNIIKQRYCKYKVTILTIKRLDK